MPSMSVPCTQIVIAVNNAGYVLGVEHVGDIADVDIEGMIATNVLGLISVTQLLVRSILI